MSSTRTPAAIPADLDHIRGKLFGLLIPLCSQLTAIRTRQKAKRIQYPSDRYRELTSWEAKQGAKNAETRRRACAERARKEGMR
jgi:hypothetical protein